ncbi:unnamed protein product [Symbiodinium sp. CCMP2592]|nr:unnamed protein product [Symbiodinium sp. CCMP2592]
MFDPSSTFLTSHQRTAVRFGSGINRDAVLSEITWKTDALKKGKAPFGVHSILEMTFSDGSTWHTQKYVAGNCVVVDLTRGGVAGDAIRGPLRGQALKDQGWVWTSPTKASDIVRFVCASEHMEKYDTRDYNCHKYAQDVWNFCVVFSHQVWWRPDMIKARLFGGLVGHRVGFDDDDYGYDDYGYDDADYDDDYD